ARLARAWFLCSGSELHTAGPMLALLKPVAVEVLRGRIPVRHASCQFRIRCGKAFSPLAKPPVSVRVAWCLPQLRLGQRVCIRRGLTPYGVHGVESNTPLLATQFTRAELRRTYRYAPDAWSEAGVRPGYSAVQSQCSRGHHRNCGAHHRSGERPGLRRAA